MLTVIQYYIIIKIKKTKTSRKDLKKEGIMRINSYNKFFAEVAKIMNTSVKAVKQLDCRYKVELANHVYLNVYRGICGSLFIHDHRGITHITSCYDFEDFKTMQDLYKRLVTDYSESDTTPSEEKHYDDYTSEDFIKAGIAKECTDCPDFCEEDCIENVECAKGNAVLDGCKTVKDQYFDTDSLQPNKKIIAKIENIHCCPHRNTCCFATPYVNCDYNYKSDICIKAYNYFIHDCEQVHKQMKAKSNPEWHHVSLATLANIDLDKLDEKRKLVRDINHILKDGIRNLYKCENHISFEVLERYVIRKCDEFIRQNRLKVFWFSYIARQLDEVRRNTSYLYAPYITAHRNRW